MIRRRVQLVWLLALLALLSAVPASQASGPTAMFRPPYSAGPRGGDQYNFVSTDPASGRLAVVRASPYPGAFNCSGSGGFAYFRVAPVVTGPVSSVTADVDSAAVDSYSWISVLVRDSSGRWLGGAKLRGPLIGPAHVRAPVAWTPSLVGSFMFIDVGLEVASACPNAGGGSARFADILVTGAARQQAGSSGGGGRGAVGAPSPGLPSSTVTTVNFEYQPGDNDPRAGARLPLRVVAGTGLAYLNADSTAPHTLTSVAVGGTGRHLFDSGPPIDAGQVAPVIGVEQLRPGSYPFYCKVHTEMRGTLEVII